MKRWFESSSAGRSVSMASLCALLTASPALAGGLYLSEFGTPAMGAAGAGAEALAEDASTALPHHNPAGMTQLEEGKHVLLGAGLIYGDIEFDPDSDTPVAGGDGGNQAGFAPMIGSFYSQSLTERVRVGASIFSASGSVLDPDNDWAGRFQLQKISLFTLGINGSIAYQVNDWLSIAGGGTILYGEVDPLSVALPNPGPDDGRLKVRNADDWAGGWNAAILLTPRPGTKIGLIYNSKLELDLSGDIRTQNFGSFALDLDLPLVQMARLGFSQELGHDFTLLGTVGWEDWSRFNNLPLSVRQANVTLETGWHDTFRFALGLRHQWNERWMLQGGVTYDTSPVSSSNRVASLPVDRQIRAAIGAQYVWSDTVNVGGSFEFINLGRGRVSNSLLRGDYDQNNLFLLSFNVSWKSPAAG